MFKAVKLLNQKKCQNPIIHDDKGHTVTQTKKVNETIKDHFYKHFNDPKERKIEPFTQKKKLNNPIAKEEVQKFSMKLKNAKVLNNIFEKNEAIPTNKSDLLTLPKPKKPKGPTKNLHPINLLPIGKYCY